jgi:hypothetical protein
MPYRYNQQSLQDLRRLQTEAFELRVFIEVSRKFLDNSRKLDEETKVRLWQRAEEARFVSAQVTDPLARDLLLELAESFERAAA